MGNLIKKSVVIANLQKKLAGWEQKKTDYDNAWPAYQKELIEYAKSFMNVAIETTSLEQWFQRGAEYHYEPKAPQLHWGYRDAVRKIKVQLAAVEAVEGDFIELGDMVVKKKVSVAEVFGVEGY